MKKILDLGCGDGHLTKKIQEYGCEVVGLDGSEEFVQIARKIGVNAVVGDGQKMTFENEFDAVFSNAALHWMLDAEGVVSGVARALKKGGRFVAEIGESQNIRIIKKQLYETKKNMVMKERYAGIFQVKKRKLLEKNGLEVKQMLIFNRPTPLPTGIKGWLETFSKPALAGIPEEVQAKIVNECSEILEKELPKNENGETFADYVRLRFEAVKR